MCIVEKEVYVLISYWWETTGTQKRFLRKETLNCVVNINVLTGLNQPYCLLLYLIFSHIFSMYVYGQISSSVVAVYEDELTMTWRTDKSVADVEPLSVTMQWCQTPSKPQGIATLNNSQQGNKAQSLRNNPLSPWKRPTSSQMQKDLQSTSVFASLAHTPIQIKACIRAVTDDVNWCYATDIYCMQIHRTFTVVIFIMTHLL